MSPKPNFNVRGRPIKATLCFAPSLARLNQAEVETLQIAHTTSPVRRINDVLDPINRWYPA